jgi:hypothetical protein
VSCEIAPTEICIEFHFGPRAPTPVNKCVMRRVGYWQFRSAAFQNADDGVREQRITQA